MPDYADETTTELERKVKTMRWVCVVETISYCALLAVWIGGSQLGVELVGSVHGTIFLAFAAMTFGLMKPLGWTWKFMAAALLTGPIGSLIVLDRLRRQPIPAPGQASAATA
jgi:integral membrane protein